MVLIILSVLFASFLALFWLTPVGLPELRRLGRDEAPPDMRFGYAPDETYRVLERYGTTGVAHWRRMLLLDMLFPAIYAALFALLALDWAEWAGAGPLWRTVAFLCPVLAGLSDYIENLLLLTVVGALPRKIPAAVIGASAFTRAKFLFSCATLLVPLLYWGATHLS